MDSVFDRIETLLRGCLTDSPHLPPTYLFNEGWMLRLVMDSFAQAGSSGQGHPLEIPPDGTWGSEVLLPTVFKAQYRGDTRAETATHADGVIGRFHFRDGTKRGVELCAASSHFIVLEAKMFSSFSTGTKNAPGFNQATRYVACMAEALCRAKIPPGQMSTLSFLVLAPASQIDNGVFSQQLRKDTVLNAGKKRVTLYEGRLDSWFSDWFEPTLQRIVMKAISWEDTMSFLSTHDAPWSKELDAFYQQCLLLNSTKGKTAGHGYT